MQPTKVRSSAAILAALYRLEWAEIQRRWKALNPRSRRFAVDAAAFLVWLESERALLVRLGYGWLTTELVRTYALGGGPDFAWNDLHTAAISDLAHRADDSLKAALASLAAVAAALVGKGGGDLYAMVYADGSRRQLDDYAATVAAAISARAFNLATLNQSPEQETWLVSDGPECGWTSHDDFDTADQTIRLRDDCLEWPIAHPNCVRSFSPLDVEQQPAEPAQEISVRAQAALAGMQASRLRVLAAHGRVG